MTDKLIDIILTEFQKKIAVGINVALWFFLAIASYNTFIDKIDIKDISNENSWNGFLFSGAFVPFVCWLVCVLIFYLLIKYVLTNLLANSTLAFNGFIFLLVPKEYRIPFLNIFYKKVAGAGAYNIKKVIEYTKKEGLNQVESTSKSLNIIFNIILKFLLLSIIFLPNLKGVQLGVGIFSLVIVVAFLSLLVVGMSCVKNKIILYKMLEGTHEKIFAI